jgi:putative heme-binding domain-containing protein
MPIHDFPANTYTRIMFMVLNRFAIVAVTALFLMPATTQATPPQAAAGDVQAGQKLFVTACRVCHGEEGVGNRAPSLRGERFTADFVSRAVKYGRPGTLMPKFEPSFSEAEINQVGRYVASLQERSAEWAALQGNAEAGRKLFFDQTRQESCHTCHTFKGQGGKVGPDLTTRLSRRSPREIFQRIVVVPHRSTDPSYLRVLITTKSGETFTGIKTEGMENQFNFYDTASLPPTLKTLPLSDVVSTKRLNGTAMPSDYASRFSLKELLDLVAFIRSSGTNPPPVTLADVVQERPRR